MKKMITIIEFPSFLSQIGKSITAEERDEFIDFLAKNPDAGDEITGTGGIRKIRWGRKGKGKRGGIRIIYYFYNESAPVFLLTVYGKGEQEDLTSEQKKQMTGLVKILKTECKATRRNHHD
jgi:mRNA-degrading endonuclease RelE of RelBE toxin-antitoxin system